MKFVKDKNSSKRQLVRTSDKPQLTIKSIGSSSSGKKAKKTKPVVEYADTSTKKSLSLPKFDPAVIASMAAAVGIKDLNLSLDKLKPNLDDYMTPEQKKSCAKIIHTASVGAAGIGAGLAQVPCEDNMLLTPLQLTMAIGLGKVFHIELSDTAARAAVSSAAACTIGRAVSQVLVGWIPGIGNAINSATAASLTEAIGWNMAVDFAKKRND